MTRHLLIAAAAFGLLVNTSSAFADNDLQDAVDQATTIIERFKDMPEKGIPENVLRDAKGVAILTVLKAGFLFSGQGGLGLVVARRGKGWSGPSAIATGGAGFGFQVGAQVTEFVLILNTNEAVEAFAHGGNVSVGGTLSAAAGPVGRTAGANVMPVAAVYTYSRSQGLFAGVAVEGMVLVTRDEANEKFYGRKVTPKEILSGAVKPPAGANKLSRALGRY